MVPARSTAQAAAKFQEQAAKIMEVAEKVEKVTLYPTNVSQKSKSLIEPKNMEVDKFAGAVGDTRDKFVEWAEHMKDRVMLCDPDLVEHMRKVERTTTPISQEKMEEFGVSRMADHEPQSFLKDKTTGIAASIVRGHRPGLSLESWRLLWLEYSPKTLTSTMRAQ